MTWEAVAVGALPLLGVLLGAALGSRHERLRWQREWTVTRIQETRTYAVEVCAAVDRQVTVLGQALDAVQGQRALVPRERVVTADSEWASALSKRYIFGSEGLQAAIAAFDRVRAEVASKANGGDYAGMRAAHAELEVARVRVFDAVQAMLNAANEALGEHLLPWWVQIIRHLRKQPLAPLAAAPSSGIPATSTEPSSARGTAP